MTFGDRVRRWLRRPRRCAHIRCWHAPDRCIRKGCWNECGTPEWES